MNEVEANLGDLVIAILKTRPGEEILSKDIAQLIIERYPAWCDKKRKKSKPDVDLLLQIANEVSSRRPQLLQRFPGLVCSETTPRRYSWPINEAPAQDGEAPSYSTEPNKSESHPEPSFSELSLYPVLAHFLWAGPYKNRVYPMRIDEKTSSNKHGYKGNSWLHPDLVGLESLMTDWNPRIRDCAEQSGDQRARLWSFEVKKSVTRSSVRHDYFQAVSNSSWANFGYLVTVELSSEAEAELRMLHGVHGIGVIKLNLQNPADSIIVIPARERPNVDWASCNRLAHENKDFGIFAKLVANFYKTHETSEKEWFIPKSIPDKD